MAVHRLFLALTVFLSLVSFLAAFGVSAPSPSEVSLEEFQRMNHINQRNYLYSSLDQPGFAQSLETMQNAVHFLNRLDWSRLPAKDGILVDKFLKKVPMDIPASRTVANRYFGKITDKKLFITSGKGLSWNGKHLATLGGAVVDPRKIPMGVVRVEEVNGNFVFHYKPDEPDMEPSRVTLRKGEFELGGMHDELSQPSRFAQFSVEGGDAEIGGIMFHPDTGRIDALGGDNYKMLDSDLQDGDPASLIMLGKNRGLRADVEVVSRQSVTFIGGTRAVFNQYSNGLLVEGAELYAKGSFDIALSEFDKDEPIAEYTFKNGILDTAARKVTPEETDSGISIHYLRKGERVVWNVDGDDFEEAPSGFPVTPAPGKPRAGEVRGEDKKTPKETPQAPERKKVGKEVEKARVKEKSREGTFPKPFTTQQASPKQRKPAVGSVPTKGNGELKGPVAVPLQAKESPPKGPLQESPHRLRFPLLTHYEFDVWDLKLVRDIKGNEDAKKLWGSLKSKAIIKENRFSTELIFTDIPEVYYSEQGGNFKIEYRGEPYIIPQKLGRRLLTRLSRK